MGTAASAAPPEPAASDEAAQARNLYDKGMAHFHLEEYDQAIDRWEAGFRIKPAPEFLYNIAQAHRLARHPDRALSFYQRYLRLAPKAPNRAEVERHVAALEIVVRQNAASASAPPTGTRDPAGRPPDHSAPDTPQPSTPPPSTITTTTPDAIVVAQPPAKKPIYKKAWFWGVIAGSAVVVIAVGAGVGIAVARADKTPVLTEVRF